MALRLRPYRIHDEAAARVAHHELLADGFHFLLAADEVSWPSFLAANERQRHGLGLGTDQVRGVQLAADVDGELVGRTSLRFSLNEFFASRGGHVGYAVVPRHRRRGYASEILRQSLIILRAEGVERVLVTCDETNVASARTIELNGGVLESTVEFEDERLRRYFIN